MYFTSLLRSVLVILLSDYLQHVNTSISHYITVLLQIHKVKNAITDCQCVTFEKVNICEALTGL